MNEVIVYCGSNKIQKNPSAEGEGFLCTEDASRAKERAGFYRLGGILNIYSLDISCLPKEDFKRKGKDLILQTEEAVRRLRFLGFGPVSAYDRRRKQAWPEEEEKAAFLIPETLCYVKRIHNENPESFLLLFCISGLAEKWESGIAFELYAMNPEELYTAVMKEIGLEPEMQVENQEAVPEQESEGNPDDEKLSWTGKIIDYIHKKTGKGFSSILEDISFRELEVLYEPLKALSMEQSFQVIREKIRQKGKKTWIQRIRRRRGLSQRELAEQSGVNLRTLQQYEIRDKDIDKAGAAKLLAMARVLSCRPEELMEW